MLSLGPYPRRGLGAQKEFEKRTDPNDKNAQALLEEMRQHIKKASEVSCGCTGFCGAHGT